jgi:signal transduction histidine kinase
MFLVRVRDEGPVHPPEQHAREFERIARLSNELTQAQPGSVLGLAICKQLVEAMGGTIWVESTGRNGEGSCFSFTLASGSQSNALDPTARRGEDDGKVQARLQSRQERFAVPALW